MMHLVDINLQIRKNLNCDYFIAVAFEIFALLRCFAVQVGVLSQVFRKRMMLPSSEFKESKKNFLAWALRTFVIISELLQCHTKFGTRCLQIINHFRVP